ncbi:MAG TPA: tetratricopeptide repeat protein, partial [Caldimonas sp.]
MTRRDPRGNAVSTASATALDASERALWRMMSFYGAPLGDLDAAIAADPGWALPRLMKAGFLLSLTEPSLAGEAAALLAGVAANSANANERERDHLGALQWLAAGDWVGASDAWTAILRAHPRDALALQWGHLFDFYRGDAALLRERVAAALPAWPDDDPLYPYVLALHAFGLEESGRYEEAEATGRRALAGTARV